MIYLVTALYAEAKPFIERYGLKKLAQQSRFQLFQGGEMALIVSGTGPLHAAVATAHLLTRFPAKPDDVILNVGICGSASRAFVAGEAFLCHKIIHHDTGKAYYPDLLIRHSFKEAVLETFSRPVFDPSRVRGQLADMEGAGFYEAASAFLPPHNIYCIKVVSDFLEPPSFSGQEVSRWIEAVLPPVAEVMENAARINQREPLFTDEEEELLTQVCAHLRFTATMRHQVKQLARQYKIRSGNPLSFLRQFLELEIHSKKEGKIWFEHLKNQLLQP